MGFSLYVHIPYCQSKCPYCDFNSHAAVTWPEEAYVGALMAELRARLAELPWTAGGISTIFFGGGTPSLFEPESIERIIECANHIRPVESGAEVTLEANPGTVTLAKFAGYRAAGVNRISMGAQSFDAASLRFLGRIHGADDTREAARLAHRAGFSRLNLDLIFALPGQTPAAAIADIDAAAELGPDHISAYNLTFEEGTAFFSEMRRGRIIPMPSDDQAEIFQAVRESLARRGYPMYEISNYAPAGHESRHNLTYWHGESYLGIGAGAHSFARDGVGGRRWWNERAPGRYIEIATASGRAETGAETTDGETAAGEFVFLNLRLRAGFRINDFDRRFVVGFDSLYGERAARLIEDGLLERDDGNIRLTERGLELADSVFAEFV